MPNNFFIQENKLEPKYQYLADIFVIKEGCYVLWVIPFASNSKEAAEYIMAKKAREEFPECDGILDFQIEHKEQIGLFHWTPNIIIKGKIVKKFKEE
jgi:hypothetical protein